MYEEIPKALSPEELEKLAGESFLEHYIQTHPDKFQDIPLENRREHETERAAFESMINDFESNYPLEDLLAILTAEEAMNHPLRESAKKALMPICEQLNILKDETNISEGVYENLKMRWKKISDAVGYINSGKVRHE